jgi:hypothetical protein
VPPLWHESFGTGRLSYLVHRVGTPAALAVLGALALVLRLRSLESASILEIEEGRLTLAAQGVANHGWPVFPSRGSGGLATVALKREFVDQGQRCSISYPEQSAVESVPDDR